MDGIQLALDYAMGFFVIVGAMMVAIAVWIIVSGRPLAPIGFYFLGITAAGFIASLVARFPLRRWYEQNMEAFAGSGLATGLAAGDKET